jgi:hypothetical protein
MTFNRFKIHRIAILIPLAFAVFSLSACKEENYLANESRSLMLYQKNNTNGNLLALAKAQAETIGRAKKSKELKPGMCADYAVSLAKLGLSDEANKWFNKERSLFPASAKFVDAMKAKYVGSSASDTSSLPASLKTDDKLLASFMFNDADDSLEPILPDVSDEFDDDPAAIKVDVSQNPEMSAKEVAALERGKNAKTDEEKAMSAEERAKAKKQAQKEKEKAKKKAAKEKEKAKKQAQKEKEAARKQAQKEKEAARKQAAAEKAAAKEKAAREKEEARAKAAEERQRQREAAALERERQRAERAAAKKN